MHLISSIEHPSKRQAAKNLLGKRYVLSKN